MYISVKCVQRTHSNRPTNREKNNQINKRAKKKALIGIFAHTQQQQQKRS